MFSLCKHFFLPHAFFLTCTSSQYSSGKPCGLPTLVAVAIHTSAQLCKGLGQFNCRFCNPDYFSLILHFFPFIVVRCSCKLRICQRSEKTFFLFFKKIRSSQRSCKGWFVIVTSETGKQPENKEKTNQNIKKKGRYEL